ncbi:MAG TPA: HAD family hydrolase [Caulifigura sp.]|jgi:histidinol phosphatase-like enzyme|nr:HAD family hydrolase [Caulifigura sp.]
MGKSLAEYLDWVEARPGLIWPKPPTPVPIDADPYTKPIPEIRAVSWCVYGTLLHIHDGQLMHLHPQVLRMQVALQKTIDEFHMWNSMSRKPGQPWEYMLQQYSKLIEEARLAGTKRKGDTPEIDSSKVWLKLVERLIKNEYTYDESTYGDVDSLAVKVAYFFHAMLQGISATESAPTALQRIAQGGLKQGLIDDGQAFTFAQLQHCLQKIDPNMALGGVINADLVAMSYRFGIRKPSPSLYAVAAEQYRNAGIEPSHVLYVSHRLHDDLAIAKKFGFRTALYAGDEKVCDVDGNDLRNPEIKPDRLLTDLNQVAEVVGV